MGSSKSKARPTGNIILYHDVPQALSGSGTFQGQGSESLLAELDNTHVRRKSRVVPVTTRGECPIEGRASIYSAHLPSCDKARLAYNSSRVSNEHGGF